MNEPALRLHSGPRSGYSPGPKRATSPVKSSPVKKSQVPAAILIEAIWSRQPSSLRCGCSSAEVALVPPKSGLGEDRHFACALPERRRRDQRDGARRRRRARPRAVLHALPLAVALDEIDALPIQPAAVRGDARAIGPRQRQIAVGIVIGAADRHRAERGQRQEGLPLAVIEVLLLVLGVGRELVADLDRRKVGLLVRHHLAGALTELEGATAARSGPAGLLQLRADLRQL